MIQAHHERKARRPPPEPVRMSTYRVPENKGLVDSDAVDPSHHNGGGVSGTYYDPTAGETLAADDFRVIDPHSGVKRGLKTRHLSMMALAGIIGPGLLVGAGGALSSGGPASLLIGFGVIGLIAFSIMQSLGELTTLYPSGGAFTALADRFVDKAFGVAVGWNYFVIWFAVLANEYNTICSILVFWSDKVPLWGYFLILWVSLRSRPFHSVGLQQPMPLNSLGTVHTLTTVIITVCLPRFSALGSRDLWRGRILARPAQTRRSSCLLHFFHRLRRRWPPRRPRHRIQILA